MRDEDVRLSVQGIRSASVLSFLAIVEDGDTITSEGPSDDVLDERRVRNDGWETRVVVILAKGDGGHGPILHS